MFQKLSIFILFFASAGFLEVQAQSEPFITVWKSDNPGNSNENQITIPGVGTNYTIEWMEVEEFNDSWLEITGGDSGSDTGTDEHTITFEEPGIYQVSISGDFTQIHFNDSGDRLKILEVTQWGDIEWSTMTAAFFGAANLNVTATDAPDLSRVPSMRRMFRDALSLNADFDHWNTENVQVMSELFSGAESFNGKIDNWNTEIVFAMDFMFADAVSFNQDISSWNTGNVRYLSDMFKGAESFNQDLGNFDISSVEIPTFEYMLDGSGLSVENYDNTLIGWSQQTDIPVDATLGATGLHYCHSADDRQDLIDNGWEIIDEGVSVYCEEPGPAALLSPDNEAERVSIQPELIWNPVDLAQSYELALSPNSDFSDPIVEETDLTDTTYTPTFVLDRETGYFWRVRATNVGGDGPWSEARFTTGLMVNGSGTDDDPYQISNAEELNVIREDLTAYYIVTENISLAFDTNNSSGQFWNNGNGWEPIGTSENPFEGSLNGNGHLITGLYINRSDRNDAGLFGSLHENAEITDLGIENGNVSGATGVGILAGLNEGTITRVYVTGSVSGESTIGGIAGTNTGMIATSYAKASVTSANHSAGGLIGANNGILSDSYASGQVDGDSDAGGLIGRNFNNTVTGSYWNTEVAGQNSGVGDGFTGGFTGLSTTEMRRQDSFQDWDFDDTWQIQEELSYPYLQNVPQDPPPGLLETPQPVTLLEPDDGDPIDPGAITFAWNASQPGVQNYGFELAGDESFDQILVELVTTDTTITLDDLATESAYYWRVRAENPAGWGDYSEVRSIEMLATDAGSIAEIPEEFGLGQNYPNPFNPATVIAFSLPEEADVQLVVYDLLGRAVVTLINETMSAGSYEVTFDASQMASGVYIYRLEADHFVKNRTMTFVK